MISIIKCKEDCDKLQFALDKLIEWSKKWLLKFNNDKCKVMHVGTNNVQYDYVMETKLLSKTKQNGKQSKKNVGNDKKFVQLLRYYNSMKLLFTSLVRPRLKYAAPIWNLSSIGIGKIKQIENIQRRATKIPELKGLSYTDRLFALNLPSLEKRRLRGDLIEFFKIMKGKVDIKWHNPPRVIKLDRESRHHNQQIEKQLTKVRTTRYDFLPNRIANQWNSLKQSTMDLTTTYKFKNAKDESIFNY
jgi:ribonucleases P/MRP protein subunit RPP40